MTTIYHCCVQKTASMWFRTVFSDMLFSSRVKVVSPVYKSYQDFLKMEKPNDYKVFFIMRDPRDCVVSWYFSTKYSHSPIDKIPVWREWFKSISREDGLKASIEVLVDVGYFDKQLSWAQSLQTIFYYEQFAIDDYMFMRRLVRILDIDISDGEIKFLCNKYSFNNIAGRDKGQEDKRHQYRKGVPGDWKNYFTEDVYNCFKKLTDNIHRKLGYEN